MRPVYTLRARLLARYFSRSPCSAPWWERAAVGACEVLIDISETPHRVRMERDHRRRMRELAKTSARIRATLAEIDRMGL